MSAAPHAYEDLDAGLLRVLHERSFIDDPTRLWRLGRYAARLGFRPERHTAALAQATRSRAARSADGLPLAHRAELRLALAEEDPLATAARRCASWASCRPRASAGELDEPLLRDALALLPADGRRDVLLLASAVRRRADAGGGDRSAARPPRVRGRRARPHARDGARAAGPRARAPGRKARLRALRARCAARRSRRWRSPARSARARDAARPGRRGTVASRAAQRAPADQRR